MQRDAKGCHPMRLWPVTSGPSPTTRIPECQPVDLAAPGTLLLRPWSPKVKVTRFQLFLKKLQNRKVVSSQLYLMLSALRATFWKGSQPALFTGVAKRKHFCSVPTFPEKSGKWKSRKVCSRPTFLNDFADSWNASISIAKVSFWDIPDSESPHEKTTPVSPSFSIDQEHSFYALGRPCVSELLKRSVPGAARSSGLTFRVPTSLATGQA